MADKGLENTANEVTGTPTPNPICSNRLLKCETSIPVRR